MRGRSSDRKGQKPLMRGDSENSDSDSDYMQYHQDLTEESPEHDARSRSSPQSRNDEHHTARFSELSSASSPPPSKIIQPMNLTPSQPIDGHKIDIGEKPAKEKKERRKKDKKGKKEVFGEQSLFAQVFDNDPWTQMPMMPRPGVSGPTVSTPLCAPAATVPSDSVVVAPPWPPISNSATGTAIDFSHFAARGTIDDDATIKSAPGSFVPAVRVSVTGEDIVSPLHATTAVVSPRTTSPPRLQSPLFAPVVAVTQSPTSPRSVGVPGSDENYAVTAPTVKTMYAPLFIVQESPKHPARIPSSEVHTVVATSLRPVPSLEATTVPVVSTVEGTTISAVPTIEATTVPAVSTVEATAVPAVPTAEATAVPPVPTVEATVVPAIPTVAATAVPAVPMVAAPAVPPVPTVEAAAVPALPTVAATAVPSEPMVEAAAVPAVPTVAGTAVPAVPTVDATDIPAVPTVAATAMPALSTVTATAVPAVPTVQATDFPAVLTVAATAVPAVPMVEGTAVPAEGVAIPPAHVMIASPSHVTSDPPIPFFAPTEIKNHSRRAVDVVVVGKEKIEEPTHVFSSVASPSEGVRQISGHSEPRVEIGKAPPSSAGSPRVADGVCPTPLTVQSAVLDNQPRLESTRGDSEQWCLAQQQVPTVAATAVPAMPMVEATAVPVEEAAFQPAHVVIVSPSHVTSDPSRPFFAATEINNRTHRAADVGEVREEKKVEPAYILGNVASPPEGAPQISSRVEPRVSSGAAAPSSAGTRTAHVTDEARPMPPTTQAAVVDSQSRFESAWRGNEHRYPAQHQVPQYRYGDAYQPMQMTFPPPPSSEHVAFYDAPSIPLLFRCLLELPADQVNATLTQARVSRPDLNDDRWFDEKMMVWGRQLSKELRKEMEALPRTDTLSAHPADERILDECKTFKKQLEIQAQHIMALSSLIANFSTHSTDHATLLHDSRKLVDEHAALVRMQRLVGADVKDILETTGTDVLLIDFLERRRAEQQEREQNERTTLESAYIDESTEGCFEATRTETLTMDTLSSACSDSNEMKVAPLPTRHSVLNSGDESDSSSEDYEDDVKSNVASPMAEIGKEVTFDPVITSEQDTIGRAVKALMAVDQNEHQLLQLQQQQQQQEQQQPPKMLQPDIQLQQQGVIQHQQSIVPPYQQPIISQQQQQQQPLALHQMQQQQRNVIPVDHQTTSAPTSIPHQQQHNSPSERAPSAYSTPQARPTSSLPSPHIGYLTSNAQSQQQLPVQQQPVQQYPYPQHVQQQQMYMMQTPNTAPPTIPTLQHQQPSFPYVQPYMQPYAQPQQPFVPPQQPYMQPQAQDMAHFVAHAQMMSQVPPQSYGATNDQVHQAPPHQSPSIHARIPHAPQHQEPYSTMPHEQQLQVLHQQQPQQLYGTVVQNNHVTHPVTMSGMPEHSVSPPVTQPPLAGEFHPVQEQYIHRAAERSSTLLGSQSVAPPRFESGSLHEQLHVSVELTPAQEKAFSEVHLMESFAGLQDFANKEDENLFGSDSENGISDKNNNQRVDDVLPDYNPVTGLPWVRR